MHHNAGPTTQIDENKLPILPNSTLEQLDVDILLWNTKPLQCNYEISKYTQLIECRKNNNNNHICKLKKHSYTDIFITHNSGTYYFRAPNYQCGNDNNRIYNLLTNNNQFILRNNDHIITVPTIFQLSNKFPIFITEEVIFNWSNVIRDISYNATKIRDLLIEQHVVRLRTKFKQNKKYTEKEVRDAVSKQIPSKYFFDKLFDNIFINHLLPWHDEIKKFIYNKPFAKIAIDYTFRLTSNVYDWYFMYEHLNKYKYQANQYSTIAFDDNDNIDNINKKFSTLTINDSNNDNNEQCVYESKNNESIDCATCDDPELIEFAKQLEYGNYNMRIKYNIIVATTCNEYGWLVEMGLSTNNESHYDLVRRFSQVWYRNVSHVTHMILNDSTYDQKIHDTIIFTTDGYVNYVICPKIKEFLIKYFGIAKDNLNDNHIKFEVCHLSFRNALCVMYYCNVEI